MPRKELRHEDVTIICDNREKEPFNLAPLKVERGTLQTGDYTVKGLESLIAVERKSVADLVMCCGQERERFEREMERIQSFESCIVIVEGPWSIIETKSYRGQMLPDAIEGSVIRWETKRIPFWFASSRQEAEAKARRFLFIAIRERWRQLQAMSDNLKIAT